MTCKRVSMRQREEQDFYLSFLDHPNDWCNHQGQHVPLSESERLDWLRYDSHGTPLMGRNRIYQAKQSYGQMIRFYQGADGGDRLGVALAMTPWWVWVGDWVTRKPQGIRVLGEIHGKERANNMLFDYWRWLNTRAIPAAWVGYSV